MHYLGIDTGGTFTDFVLWQDGQLRIHKVLSTPEAPERAILQGIEELGIDLEHLKVVHGSTVATNAVLEGKGVHTLLIVNRGFADILTIGRQNRQALYRLQPDKPAPPLPPEDCLETTGRLSAQGEWLEPLTDADLADLKAAVVQKKPRAVAVNLLFSWLNDEAERRIRAALPSDVFVSLSSEVLPEIREYERGMATWLNAWVGPLMQGYLERLQKKLPCVPLAIMQSSGETVAAEQAGRQAVRLLLSGPAGGLVAAGFVGEQAGFSRILSFDMGGTSTDVALLEGKPRLTNAGKIGRYPVAVPMVDMHTIGAGGGSIAWLDAGGMLQVGPESAGADPGPACYGRGGKAPTVTDANLLLGRLLPDAFLGGRMRLDVQAAERAMAQLARGMACSPVDAARGIVRLANEHMARALRAISIQRGVDPKQCVLMSFGGAGGLHVCALAQALGMRQAIVPVQGGVLSALGMLVAQPGRQLVHSWLRPLHASEPRAIEQALQKLHAQGSQQLFAEGIAPKDCHYQASVDLRYQGQSHTLNLPWTGDVPRLEHAFHRLHRQRYGHDMALPVELVNLRMAVHGPALPVRLQALCERAPAQAYARRTVVGVNDEVAVYARAMLAPEQTIVGPALITEETATTWIEPGWQVRMDKWGNLVLHHQGDSQAG